jgi:hypothetical protein
MWTMFSFHIHNTLRAEEQPPSLYRILFVSPAQIDRSPIYIRHPAFCDVQVMRSAQNVGFEECSRRPPEPPPAPCALRGDEGRHLPAPASACGMDCGVCRCGCRVNVGGPCCSCACKIASTIGRGLVVWVLPRRIHSLSAFANHGAEHTDGGEKSHLLGALDAAEPALRA